MLALAVLVFLLGLRHAIDFDHIAALTDITGTTEDKREGFIYGTLYVLGHALMVIIFGFLAVLFSFALPESVGIVFERIVGVTLIFLSVYLIFSLVKYKDNYKLQSRWMLIFRGIHKIHHKLLDKFGHKHKHQNTLLHYPETYGKRTSFGIGVLHGIGAETPTQILLFVTAAGTSHKLFGAILVLVFVAGLITSHTIMNLISVFSYANTRNKFYNLFGGLSALFSLVVGVKFLI